MIVMNNTCRFPVNIEFDKIPQYSRKFDKLGHNKTIIFDLSETDIAHSSFIGFLIYAKQKIEKRGGRLILKISRSLERLLKMIKLTDYLLPGNQGIIMDNTAEDSIGSPDHQLLEPQPQITH